MLHLSLDRTRPRGLARQLAAGVREAIRAGRLESGTRLPPSRELAADLGVSRGVVVEAYAQLTAEGFLIARQGAGTRVAKVVPGEPTPTSTVERSVMRLGTPDLTSFPRKAWLAATRHVLNTVPHRELGYPEPLGAPALREALAAHLNRVRAASVTPGSITVVGGVAHGLSLVFRALGPLRLAIEDPTSPRQLPLLRGAGATLLPVPVDEEGMDTGRLPDAEAALLTPAHQYPTGVVLSPERRALLQEWLTGDRLAVEDDYDAEFRYDRDPVGCLQGLRPDRTVHIGSVSKTLAPALRLGWVAAPPRLIARLAELRSESDLGSPVLEQLTLARLIETGEYDRHVRAMRLRYRARRDALVTALAAWLPEARVRGVSAGQHLYVELPGRDEADVLARAHAAGLPVDGGGDYRLVHEGPAALVLGFGGSTEDAITATVRALAEAIA
ncbi:GntR family transcriptional regulator [Actinorhabdospora filicis]|uniref:GntR family transcriptional regulator n=1 Tax=Actinorhabdospora filicis TaxID=1785913 RepID=A0A9W6SRL1_9ACTN|nr:PLP-dependent aminotransferase family protein [Actinorhabdospora filicis]GLZ80694.1 GntR family transcriptional regulator [Actinorhabdospora filicis]